jgi:hypothetical protein
VGLTREVEALTRVSLNERQQLSVTCEEQLVSELPGVILRVTVWQRESPLHEGVSAEQNPRLGCLEVADQPQELEVVQVLHERNATPLF